MMQCNPLHLVAALPLCVHVAAKPCRRHQHGILHARPSLALTLLLREPLLAIIAIHHNCKAKCRVCSSLVANLLP